jgi:hypothetical protein
MVPAAPLKLTTEVAEGTVTGVLEYPVMPFPKRPAPQHLTVPSETLPQESPVFGVKL